MGNEQNWRTETDALSYFRNQQKQLEVADRRPVIRKASDLVGPGISGSAVRVDDYNDLLATFNGYYSSAPGAGGAPNPDEAFVGYTVSDAEYGGRQVLTGLDSNITYSRTFVRSPVDPEALAWGEWTGPQRIAPSIECLGEVDTDLLNTVSANLTAPTITKTLGASGYYERTSEAIRILKPGVYTGYFQIGDRVGATTLGTLVTYRPSGTETLASIQLSVPLGPTVHIPFTVWATDEFQGFRVVGVQSSGSPRSVWWRFACSRISDAI